jgi:hypothetical protein
MTEAVSYATRATDELVTCLRIYADADGVLAEDTTGKGHISRHPPQGQLLMFVDLA